MSMTTAEINADIAKHAKDILVALINSSSGYKSSGNAIKDSEKAADCFEKIFDAVESKVRR